MFVEKSKSMAINGNAKCYALYVIGSLNLYAEYYCAVSSPLLLTLSSVVFEEI